MRLIAVSVVKNDADIVEAFVRHTSKWVDHHLIFDHDSTDGTREILAALQREGLALTLFTDDAIGNLQQARSNHLTRLAVQSWHADWVLVLDADEILIGPGRTELSKFLAQASGTQPVSVPLLNYYRTTDDDPSVVNPVDRLHFCQSTPSSTRKLFIPKPLAVNPAAVVGMGSHALYLDGQAVPNQPLPTDYWLAHLSLRTAGQQVMRVIASELQKISGGRRQAGLALHYRLGYQLLSEKPDLFLATTCPVSTGLRSLPIEYDGGELRYPPPGTEWTRLARSLLPYLEKLAVSHGNLIDRTTDQFDPGQAKETTTIRELPANEIQSPSPAGATAAFSGFTALEGWGPPEGPVPEAFLPSFHWSYAPVTVLLIHANQPCQVHFIAEGLTYSENQVMRVELNGASVVQHAFSRVNQKETIRAPLTLRSGENRLSLHYNQSLVTDFDARRLAVIFLSLRVLDATAF